MSPDDRRKLIEAAIAQAEQHEEEMRLSYVLARNRTECLRKELADLPLDTLGPHR